jgi:hypothetical protein
MKLSRNHGYNHGNMVYIESHFVQRKQPEIRSNQPHPLTKSPSLAPALLQPFPSCPDLRLVMPYTFCTMELNNGIYADTITKTNP